MYHYKQFVKVLKYTTVKFFTHKPFKQFVYLHKYDTTLQLNTDFQNVYAHIDWQYVTF